MPADDGDRTSARGVGDAPRWYWLDFRQGVSELLLLIVVLGTACGLITTALRQRLLREWVDATAARTGVRLGHGADQQVVAAFWRSPGVPGALRARAILPRVQIADDDFAFLLAYDQLEELCLEDAVMTDPGLAVAGKLPRLRKLSCFWPRITDRGLAYLRDSSQLESLRMIRAKALTDAGLVHLSNLTNLQVLDLSSCPVTGPGLAHLAGMRRLSALVIRGAPLTDDGLAHLGKLISLRELDIRGGKYSDAGVVHLSRLRELTKLSLGSSGLTEDGLATIVVLPRLEVLQLNGPGVTDAWLDRLAAIKTLRELHLGGARVGDEAIERLKRAVPGLLVLGVERPT
jgi:hypothetical protein